MNQIIDYSGYDGVGRSILKVKKIVSNNTEYLNPFSNKIEMYRKRMSSSLQIQFLSIFFLSDVSSILVYIYIKNNTTCGQELIEKKPSPVKMCYLVVCCFFYP